MTKGGQGLLFARPSWFLWAICVASALASASIKLTYGSNSDEATGISTHISLLVAFLVFATVGAIILARGRGHPIGWIYLVGALSGCAGRLSDALTDVGTVGGIPIPGITAAFWIESVLGPVSVLALVTLPLLLFPSGRLASRRWRPVAWAAVASITLVGARFAFWFGHLGGEKNKPVNPLGIPGSKSTLAGLSGIGMLVLVVTTVIAIGSLFRRFRRTSGVERQQLKLLGWAGVWTLVLVFIAGPGTFSGVLPRPVTAVLVPTTPYLLGLAIAMIPAATAVAILRYRLYEIDRIVSRTIAYALITGLILGVYGGSIVLFQLATRPFIRQSDLAVAASTLVAAAAFRPLRRRVQKTIDYRFNRARYDAAEAIQIFAVRLRDEIDIHTLSVDLQTLVHHTMEPASVSLWLRESQ